MRSAVTLLALSAMVLATATITLRVEDGKVALSKIVVEAKRGEFPVQYEKSLISSNLVATDKLLSDDSSVREIFSTNSVLMLSSSPLKKGHSEITLSIVTNPSTASVHGRIKGSLLILFFYIRNMDVAISSVIDKQKDVGNLTIDGFAELPSPKVTVERMLNRIIPKIKSDIEKLGLRVVELKYEVTGKTLPPTSKIKVHAVLEGKKENIIESLDSLGVPTSNILNLINTNDTVVRKVNAKASLDVYLKRSGKELLTVVKGKINGDGIYLNDTVQHELRNRLEPVLSALNATELEDYLLPAKNVTSSLTINIDRESVKAKFVFTNVYFDNTAEFWKTLEKLQKELGLRFEVLCHGEVYTVKKAASLCTS